MKERSTLFLLTKNKTLNLKSSETSDGACELSQKGKDCVTWNPEKIDFGHFSGESRKFFLGEFPKLDLMSILLESSLLC